MTTSVGAAAASMPSMQADDSPRRPMRRRQRIRLSLAAIALTSALVPSGESSSTKISSHEMPRSASSSRAMSSWTFCRSLNVGTTIESCSAAGAAAKRPVRCRTGFGGPPRGRAPGDGGLQLVGTHSQFCSHSVLRAAIIQP